ncbi:MAG: hypothetical protein ACJAYR_000634 [Sneathiella sp.]|jgi:hypothetical protein
MQLLKKNHYLFCSAPMHSLQLYIFWLFIRHLRKNKLVATQQNEQKKANLKRGWQV